MNKKIISFLLSKYPSLKFRLFRSYAWDEYQVLVKTNSISNVFFVTDALRALNFEGDSGSMFPKTETTLGLNVELMPKKVEEQKWPTKRFEKLVENLDDRDELNVIMGGISPNEYSYEDYFNQVLVNKIDTYRVAGKVDLFIQPRITNSVKTLSTRNLVKHLIHIYNHVSSEGINIEISTTFFKRFVQKESEIKKRESPSLKNNQTLSQSQLEDFYNQLKVLKVPTPERSALMFLIKNYNRYLANPTIANRILSLEEPITTFIADINDIYCEYRDRKYNYSPYLISRKLKAFTKALEQAIENILHSSPVYEKTSDIFITTKCSMSEVLAAYNKMCSTFAQVFGVPGFFVHFDYDCEMRITDQSLNLNLYNLIKPERFCGLIGAEMFNLYLVGNREEFKKYPLFTKYSQLRMGEKALIRFKNAVEVEFLFKIGARLELKESQILDLINKDFVDHVYMDLFNYWFFFDAKKELFGFWYWSIFLMNTKKLDFKEKNQIGIKNLRIRMLRYGIVQRIVNIKDGFEGEEHVTLYPKEFSEELSFSNFSWELSQFINNVTANRAINKWMKQTISLFSDINQFIDLNSNFTGYKENIFSLLNEVREEYLIKKEHLHFSNSGALVLNKEQSDQHIFRINELRIQFLLRLIKLSKEL
ncbi:hypothetical protein [Croceivirga thetidis]|uniref:hypothetical protein n=1 Tax=Croceivirga thetidis TaxID=2721623 RepID=UPI001B2FF27F|nr:hypothetical protein [Croceivirga thetidis]